ncbi:peptidase M38 (plasmid) [Pseudonocardia sp. EC080610-09]|uniref:metal-dependent hydrolase family protein n=1 Tax=unclassified Pseudonocardia TaxID=2619320 RepID=UPI0007061948|nr:MULTISPECIES: amidohydrolase family protein [unclassified Pseudonocardia]ALL79279.1 peptidase M38 [Pseudonocardia sp. EC080610-09]ALL85249.1 peptidase M38 [Pseudonocardia sp. EC080619-01]
MWLIGATVVDGTGSAPQTGRAVLAEDGRIAEVGAARPSGAEVVDCAGLTLVPGLIDAHVHFGLSSPIDASLTHGVSVAELAADMFENCRRTLASGFTTVRDTGGIDAGLAGVVAAGKVAGPRILCAGPLLCQSGGHGHIAPEWEPTADWPDHHVPGLRALSLLCDGPDEMRKGAREAFRRGADFLKLCVTGGVVSRHDKLTDTQFDVSEIAAAVAEASARGTYVTVHAHNNAGIRNAVAAGVRCVEHGSQIDDETAALMAEHDVAHVPTLAVVEALLDDATATGLPASIADRVGVAKQGQIDAIHASRRAGVRIGSGSDLIGPGQDNRGRELLLRSQVESPMAALVSATSVNADILGIGDEVGTIEPGKHADLVAFRGNPLEDPKLFADPGAVALVVQGGRVVRDER